MLCLFWSHKENKEHVFYKREGNEVHDGERPPVRRGKRESREKTEKIICPCHPYENSSAFTQSIEKYTFIKTEYPLHLYKH